MAALAGQRIGLLTARASRANGGVFEAVVGQVGLLKRLGAVPVVVAVDDEAHAADAWRLDGAEVGLAEQVGPDQPGFAPQLAVLLKDAKLGLLHLHGIWTYASRAAAHWADSSGGPLVISPHGMLDPWITERNRWKKNLARFAWERDAWKSATAVHALTLDEAADIDRETGGAEIGIIPNPAPKPSAPRDRIAPPMALYLGRIHGKKNLIALMEGWLAALPDLPTDASLTIAGWGDEEGVAALERFLEPVGPSIQFVGAAFGSQKAALFDVARFTVLPSLSEGLPMAILDSWAAGVPTIMSEACHLPEGYETGAASHCGRDKASIARALVKAFAMKETAWLSMTQAAQALASGPFGPEQVAEQWERLYEDCLRA